MRVSPIQIGDNVATLSNPTATETGSTTASGTVDTDTNYGTLYYLVSESLAPWGGGATESEKAAYIIANGDSQAVTS